MAVEAEMLDLVIKKMVLHPTDGRQCDKQRFVYWVIFNCIRT